MEMSNNRTRLPDKYILNNNGTGYQITDEVGRGANCIVYNASYVDFTGIEHLVRVKELYPIYLLINRDEKFEIHCDEKNMEKFEEAKKRFETSFEKNVKFRNTYGIMNSTVNSTYSFAANETMYVVMNLDEGEDYRSYKDRSLTETLTHVKTLTSVIAKYHEGGYLHLDIKPENIFVIPETPEHIYLFDFDSVCKLSDLETKKIIDLSLSEGFSAPEQVQGKISKIGTHTDIYAIGAVLFYKLFERKPTLDDERYSARYDFKSILFYDKTIRPSFYRKLEEFFHKSLATSTIPRWKEMQVVIDALDKLIDLSNTEENYLINSFSYNSAYFVGRLTEFEEIHDVLQSSNVLFLSGIGGIGKTELAKKYAAEYRAEYDSITFAYYTESIEHTVCQEIKINNLFQEEEESESEYFGRVIEALQRFATEKDLIIIDNFDVESDNKLEELLRCPCKFLFTTRSTNVRDWNYEEIKIGRMGNLDDLLDLFSTYNSEYYDEDESEGICKLIDFVDGHTMTVELISKYLRDSVQKPSDLYKSFMEKSGVTNTDDSLNVNQRKDFKMNSESVNRHLSILFDVFNFNRIATEIISSLSLFAGIRIRRDRFEDICTINDIRENLDVLIDKGWVENNEETGKISLHQVIQDLIFTKLKPTSMSCPHIVSGMLKYKNEEVENYTARRVRNKVFDVFAVRITGGDVPYAQICYKYGSEAKVDEAIEICDKINTRESFGLLNKLYMKKIYRLTQADDYLETEESDEEYGKRVYLEICELLQKAIDVCHDYSDENDELLSLLVDIGSSLDEWLDGVGIAIYISGIKELENVVRMLDELFAFIGENIMQTTLSEEKKIDILIVLRDFYSEEKISFSSYKCGNHKDVEKAYVFQKYIEQLLKEKDGDKNIIYVDGYEVDTSTRANSLCENGLYAEAINLFLNGYENGNFGYDYAFGNVADIYLQMGNADNVIKYYELILEYDRYGIEKGRDYTYYSSYICVKLLKVLDENRMFDKLAHYAWELIKYEEKEIDLANINNYVVSNVLIAYYYLYITQEIISEREEYWGRCKELFDLLGVDELHDDLSAFVLEYIKREELDELQTVALVDRFAAWNTHCEAKEELIKEVMAFYKGKENFGRCHILLLLRLAIITNEYPYPRIKEGLRYCEEAEIIVNNLEKTELYYVNKILQIKSNLMSNDDSFEQEQVLQEKKKSDYYEIASYEAIGKAQESQIEIWKDAASDCHYADKYEEELKCLEQALSILLPIMNKYDYSSFNNRVWYIMGDMVNANVELNRNDEVCSLLSDMYKNVINQYYLNMEEEDNNRNTCYKIKDIAWNYKRIGSNLNAFRGYFEALYLAIIKRKNNKVLLKYFRNVEEVITICNQMHKQVDNLSPDAVDSAMDIKDDIERLGYVEEEYLKPVMSVLEEVEIRYRAKEIEFKET